MKKKALSIAAMSALAVSAVAVAPAQTDAAASTAAAGFYDTQANKYYTVAAFQRMTSAEKAALLTKNGVYLHTGTHVIAASYAITATNAQIAANLTPKANFTAADLDAIYKGETPVTGDLKVESVSAINGKTIEVKFNKAIDETDGADNTLFTVEPASATIAVTTAELSEDKKTVTLTLDTVLTNDTAYTVVVDKALEDAEGNALDTTNDARLGLFFADHAKPTVTSITTLENGSLKIQFNEVLGTKPAVVVNGSAIGAGDVMFTADTNFVTIAALPSGLEVGKSYPVIVQGAKDLLTNTMSLYQGNFTYSIDANAPKVTNLVAKDEKTLTVEFSEELSALPTGTEIEVIKGTTTLTGVTFTDVSNGGLSKFDIELPSTGATDLYATGETSVQLKVVIKGYKDAVNNFGTKVEKNVTINKDVQGPTLVKSELVGTDFELTFSETLAAGTPAANKFVITDTDGVAYTAVPKANSGKKVILDASGLANGTYTVKVLAGAATDTAIALNDSVATTATFTKGAADPTPGKPTVVFSQSSKGVLLATFSEAVKGGNVAGSATDLANYKLNGAALPTGTTITLNPAKTVATITLPAEALAKTQSYTLSASNVQDSVGNVMVADTQVVVLTENTKPVLSSAAVQADGTIKLTFSENVVIDGTPAGNTNDEDDFIITVAGNELTTAQYTIAAGSTGKELIVTPINVSFATGTITVKTADTTTITDAAPALNTLKAATTVTVTR